MDNQDCYVGLCLEHSIDVVIPYKHFDRNFRDFKSKIRLDDRDTNWLHYSINSDGKFRLEVKEYPDDEDYILRISGWKRGSKKKPDIHIRRIYVGEPFLLYPWVFDFLDLLEAWAVDHKGSLYLKYVILEPEDQQSLDAYSIVRGLANHPPLPDHELQELLHKYGYSERS